LLKSKKLVHDIIESEVKSGLSESRIVLGGFSQGGAVSIFTALTSKYNLAGLVSLSAYLPIRKSFASHMNPALSSLPIFMGHGTADYVVQYKWGKDSYGWLKDNGCSDVTFKPYENMQHSCNDVEIEDVREFLERCFASNVDAKESL
jgi:lysophospholipase-2